MSKEADKTGLGIAIDLGTTTIAGALVDLGSGSIEVSASLPNPQAAWGRDVISRMDAALGGPDSLGEISAAARSACSGLIGKLAGERKPLVQEVSIAGNTVMEHLFLGISPEPLSKVPYRPVFRDAKRIPASQAELGCDAGIYLFPLIGGFVGGDAVAVALALGLKKTKRPALVIDVGTNSEILLGVNGTVFATSAAAGPAFEGGEVEQGMIAGPGAIEGLRTEGDTLRLDVIGNSAPRGICGSGLVESIHQLINAGVIDRSGRILDRDEVKTNLASRIQPGKDGNSFVLYRDAKGEVRINQSDVRSLQTAKSATRAGMAVLLEKAGVKPEEVERVYVAGAFGAHLSPAALTGIGLLDSLWQEVRFVGDAALEGAALALSDRKKEEAEELAETAKYMPLSGSPRFEREFIRNMGF
ncbi:MAG: DUF4445 domain-containing protein [Deltaproteobacteria bacterium]|nr:DUF4445 domain-containing protein [Deltaproteobacteria bacterium]MBZ0220670.1 ASKHA domain-containing protein [Deltaproteobacteria bacterium]